MIGRDFPDLKGGALDGGGGLELSFASYNIRKAVGLDRKRDPERILAVLHEINADVVALQECDRRLGPRASVLPRQLLEEFHWQIAPVALRSSSIGWHGNALLVRRGIDILDAAPITLPNLEPRGAVRADLLVDGSPIRVAGMHLDLSGIRRRHQVRTILDHLGHPDSEPAPAVLMGDLNEWSRKGGAFREFGDGWQISEPGRSFPAHQPVARLDRIVASREWEMIDARVHHSALSARASDHLPVVARLRLASRPD